MPTNWPKLLRRRFTEAFPAWFIIEYALLSLGLGFMNLFPIGVSTWIARRIGDVAYFLLPERRKTALENLDVAFGGSKSEKEKKRIARESFRHLVTSLMEFARIPKFIKVATKHIRFEGTEYLDRAFSRGKGLITIMSHLGVWEYLGFATYLKRYPSAILGRAIRNPYLYRWVKRLRELLNLKYIDKDVSGRAILSELKQNHALAIAIDQWAGNEGIWINFFSKPTSTTSIPARLAKKTGCALIPAYCVRIASGKYEIRIGPEVPVRENDDSWEKNMTRELNRRLEDRIRAFPEQWTWAHKRWKDKKHTKHVIV